MENLRIFNFTVIDSKTLEVQFTHTLDNKINNLNFSIVSDGDNVPSPEILSTSISGDTIILEVQPLTYLGVYYFNAFSTELTPFQSTNATALLLEDGVANRKLFLGPQSLDSQTKNFLNSFYKDNIYKTEDQNTIVGKYVSGLANNLSKALSDINQIKSDNYISIDVVDEVKTRGAGPFDILDVEGAYEVIRVAKTKTGFNAFKKIEFPTFPSSPINLGKTTVKDELILSSSETVGTFDFKNLIITLKNKPISKLNSFKIIYNSIQSAYNYDINKYGYQINNNKYDQDFAFKLLYLKDNQIKINDKVLEDPDFSFENIFKIEIEYEYNDLGIIISTNNLTVSAVENVIRETIPSIVNVFDLEKSPIVNLNGDIATVGGVVFSDPNGIDNNPHPSFVQEIKFQEGGLPSLPGQYSIDYSVGRVYVYGQSNNDGTGAFPPLATYLYSYVYKPEIDYVYDDQATDIESNNDLVALPDGALVDHHGIVSFNYEKVLIPNIDYTASTHKEILNERINNNLLSPTIIKASQNNINKVFRVYNETSGEIYNVVRWNDDKIHVSYSTPPSVLSKKQEFVKFETIENELLFINSNFNNLLGVKIFKILLENNSIVSASQDAIGNFLNSSAFFTKKNIFTKEKWFDNSLTNSQNYDKLLIGDYCIDYNNGVIYCGVSPTQDINLGTITYKINKIKTDYPHIISVDNIYYKIDLLNNKSTQLNYTSFEDKYINLNLSVKSDESSTKDGSIYLVSNKKIGYFNNSIFTNEIESDIKNIRGLFERKDMENSYSPLNFASYATYTDNKVAINSYKQEYFDTIKYDGTHYYVYSNTPLMYLSSNITYDVSVFRVADSAELWDGYGGTILTGELSKLIIPTVNSPQLGDIVKVSLDFSINDLSRVVLDYSRGDLFCDYTYLADEIIISYEYGDNVIDFRQSNSVNENEEYYVSYKAGALRDGLINNFGTLLNIDELSNFNVDFNRERYRDIVSAALSSFLQGPTRSAIENIGNKISHITPEIQESLFDGWSLGNSKLNSSIVKTTGDFEILPGKYDNGVLINTKDQEIKLPFVSNLRLEEGSLDFWATPQWNGLDNEANLTFTITEDGYQIDNKRIFIGQDEAHPIMDGYSFSVNKKDIIFGIPAKNKDGVYIYLDNTNSDAFVRWNVECVDGYSDGYMMNNSFSIIIETDGKFHDVKSGKKINEKITTTDKKIKYTILDLSYIEQGLSFISDKEHYFFDFGTGKNQDRFSIYKDASGYLIFRIYDKYKNLFTLSHDISSWNKNETHHIGVSWKIGNPSHRDEMHLFVDGKEIPNIIKYGQNLNFYNGQKYRTVSREEIIGLAARDILSGIDLHTAAGSNVVSSTINFNAYNIFAGDKIYIDEIGFDTSGYIISSVNAQTLILSTNLPTTLTNGKFSINRTNYSVSSEIDLYSNFYISTLENLFDGYNLSTTINNREVYDYTVDFTALGLTVGNYIKLLTNGADSLYTILEIKTNSLVLNKELNISLSGLDYRIYDNNEKELPGLRALRPAYSISKDVNFNNILTINDGLFAGDLMLLRTLGLNFTNVKAKHYIWSPNFEHILKTKLPPPVSLEDVSLNKLIIDDVLISAATSTVSLGHYIYNNYLPYQPSNSDFGRSFTVELTGKGINFSTNAIATIDGVDKDGYSIIETILFSDYGKLDTVNQFLSVNSIQFDCVPYSTSVPACVFKVKEKYSVIKSEDSYMFGQINYSYDINSGNTLETDGYGTAYVKDANNLFSYSNVGDYLIITYPVPVAGYYLIEEVSLDRHSLKISSTSVSFDVPLDLFDHGYYFILKNNDYRSGFQNGYFILEQLALKGQAYFLQKGMYEISYPTYLGINLNPMSGNMYIGSDFLGSNQINAIIDNLIISDVCLTDKRVGELSLFNEDNFTKKFNSIKPQKINSNNLVYIDFNSYPFINKSVEYIKYNNENFIKVNSTINDKFDQSILLNKPLVLENNGILDSSKEGTIEFWLNPLFETQNDPNIRYYFDAYSAIMEKSISIDNLNVIVSGGIEKVLSVYMENDPNKINYFAGGSLETELTNVVSEQVNSSSFNIVNIVSAAVQIASVKVVGDLQNKDYFGSGVLDPNGKTIYLEKSLPSNISAVIVEYKPLNSNKLKNSQIIRLGQKLPYHKSNVIVKYIPKGMQGDRLSIFKDLDGNINFNVMASGKNHNISATINFAENTWHRLKATYKFNSGKKNDEMNLFVDGYQVGNLISIASNSRGIQDYISFKDPINYIQIGSDYTENSIAMSYMNNIRISNIYRNIYSIYKEYIDLNYSSNLTGAFPVTEDLYTTYLSNYNALSKKAEDFAILRNKNKGNFDFSVKIYDSFDIINNDTNIKEILEKLIKILKPSTSKAYISYV